MTQIKYGPLHWWVIKWDGNKPASKIREVRPCRDKEAAELLAGRLRQKGQYAEVRGL